METLGAKKMQANTETISINLESNKKAEKKPSVWKLISQDISCVFHRDPAARNRFEVIMTYPGVHAITLYRFANSLWRRNWRFLPRFMSYIARIWTSIDIHPGATIGQRFFIDHGVGVVIGETTEIGNDVTLYHGVTLGGVSWNKGKRHPTLCDNVVVGAGAKVLGPITLAKGSRVGANSVVIADVAADKTVVGIPGKIVQSKNMGSSASGDIDLNHHLIPDPVAEAVSCLLDRIRTLEQQVGILPDEKSADECMTCDAIVVCESSLKKNMENK